MSAKELKAWMQRNGITSVDIAAALKISPNTVSNFLAGKRVHRSTQAMIEGYVRARQDTGAAKAATG